MSPAQRSTQEEDEFLNDLLNDIDNSFWNATPSSPLVSPVKSQAAPKRDSSTDAQVFSTDAKDIDLEALTQGAEDWDWEADLLSPQKSPARKATVNHDHEPPKLKFAHTTLEKHALSNTPKTSPPTNARIQQNIEHFSVPCRPTFTRCIVEKVVISGAHKELVVKVDPGKERRRVVLHDDWAFLDIQKGDVTSIVGSFETISESTSSITSSITINSQLNLLVLHPDILLTPTALANALQCRRKPLLSHLVRNPMGDSSPSLIWGSMLHLVVQSCLATGQWNDQFIGQRIDDVVSAGLLDLIKVRVDVDQAKREIRARAKGLPSFAERYISSYPKPTASLTNTRATRSQTASLAVSHFYDSEEDIWSPEYGLKGKIDATVQAVISETSHPHGLPVISSKTLPFEIKTGRTVAGMEHRAQTMLYTLLIAERYGVEVPSGLLYYTQSEEVVNVPVGRNEIRGLMMVRNEMAAHMIARYRDMELGLSPDTKGRTPEAHLPPPINDPRICKRCDVVDTCMLYSKAVEHMEDESSPVADTYAVKTGHLTPAHCSFFEKWEALISLEEQDLIRFKKELWTMNAVERETKGRCFGSMVMDNAFTPPSLQSSNSLNGKIHKFTYRFVRRVTPSGNLFNSNSLLNGHLGIGDAITISAEPHLLAYAQGFILDLTHDSVTAGIDHELDLKVLRTIIQKRTGVKVEEVIFRMDRDELFAGMSRIRGNLAYMFFADGDTKRMELVVDLKEPTFDDPKTLSPQVQSILERYTELLNLSQRDAITKVLTARQYALILGMPGTGKTTVIATLTKILVELGKTVLLVSYTHSAVDSIMLKLKSYSDLGMLRLGNFDKVHPDIRPFTISAQKSALSMEELQQLLLTPPVVATTCLSLDNPLFSRREFDYCIVDEASQITLPTCIGPLRHADKFVLVGDHFQLPPLVRNPHARKGGLDVSLFRRLSDAHPHAAIDLVYQYRMNKEIMTLSNELIYGNRLKCGSKIVEERSLRLPNPEFLGSIHSKTSSCPGGDNCWIEHLTSETCKAVFVDTDLVPARDSRVGDLVQNEIEAELVFQITETLLRCGVRERQIGVISLYRQQIKLLSQLLQERKEVEILTADRSQGRDKDCVIISLVRSNDAGQIGDLVKDWRRMNVAFTRAKSKLILFGSRKTLEAAPLLCEFFKLVHSEGWLYQLPPSSHEMHPSLRSFGKVQFPLKRSSSQLASTTANSFKENLIPDTLHPNKRAKGSPTTAKAGTHPGLLRGRPLLQDLINEEKRMDAGSTASQMYPLRYSLIDWFPQDDYHLASSMSTLTRLRVAIVTGAAQGIGRAIAVRLARDGHHVALSDLPSQAEKLQEVAEEIKTSYSSSRTLIIPSDISLEDDVDMLVDRTVKGLGGLDVMVANAGIFRKGSILDATVTDWQNIFSVNVMGTFLCFKVAAKAMIQRGNGGRLIAASALGGKKAFPGVGAYCASKAAIRSLTQSTASELGVHGITVNAYAPGVVDTPQLRSELGSDGAAPLIAASALKRMGQPSDVASVVSFLASEESRYMTGQTLTVDGGVWFD